MSGVPDYFKTLSNVLANYNFVDIASGTGYVNFYAGTTVDLKLLSNFTYYSDTIYDNDAPAGGGGNYTGTLRFDHDYDILLNRPMDIKGLGIVNIPVSVQTGAATTGSVYAEVYLAKWDGSTETAIVNNTSRIFSSTGAVAYSMLAVDLNIPLNHFKIGEYIRLTIKLYDSCVGVGLVYVGYAHDPKSRTTTWDTTGAVPSQLSFQCPVRLNL